MKRWSPGDRNEPAKGRGPRKRVTRRQWLIRIAIYIVLFALVYWWTRR